MRLSHTLIGAARTDQEVTAWSPSEGGPLETRQKDGLAMIWAKACGVGLSKSSRSGSAGTTDKTRSFPKPRVTPSYRLQSTIQSRLPSLKRISD